MPDRGPAPDWPPLPVRLIEGYRAFRAGAYAAARDRYRRLAEAGQRPSTMIVACSDSRSAPDTIFDAGPGELFVVRNVAALVPHYAPDSALDGMSAALEYAVLALDVGAIVVLGHGRCGGIAAAIDRSAPLSAADFVGRWVAGIRALEAEVEAAGTGQLDASARRLALERRSIQQSLANLRTFPWVQDREGAGVISLRGAWFDISLGELHVLGADGWRGIEPGEAAPSDGQAAGRDRRLPPA